MKDAFPQSDQVKVMSRKMEDISEQIEFLARKCLESDYTSEVDAAASDVMAWVDDAMTGLATLLKLMVACEKSGGERGDDGVAHSDR